MGDQSMGVLAVAVAAAPIGLVLMYHHPRFAFLTFLIALALPVTQLGWDTRPVATVAVAAQLLRTARLGERDRGGPPPRGQVGLAWLVALFASSVTWSQSPSRTIAAVAAWIVLLVAIHVFARALPPEALVQLVFVVIVGILFVSALAIALGLGWASEGGRGRGLLENANGLGVLGCLAAPYLSIQRLYIWRWFGLGTVVFLLMMSASRAGALGAIAAVATVAAVHGAALRRIMVVVVALSAAGLLSIVDWGTYNQDTGILRTNNSREQVWAMQTAQFWDHPAIGTGFGTQNGLGSSYLKLAAELGTVGLAAAGAMLIFLLLMARNSPYALGVVVAGLVNATFEGWLLTAGSFYSVCLFIVATTASRSMRTVPAPTGEAVRW